MILLSKTALEQIPDEFQTIKRPSTLAKFLIYLMFKIHEFALHICQLLDLRL